MVSWFAVRCLITALWVAWFYPFVFRAPHNQKRNSVISPGPTRLGLLLESAAIFLASVFPGRTPPGPGLLAAGILLATAATVMGWQAVAHLGRQFRITAGLYEDHQLVCSGPYGIVRHPIYASLLTMLVVTFLLLTPWPLIPISLAIYITGTEIRVHAEEKLLLSRFGDEFRTYQQRVPAYIPFVR